MKFLRNISLLAISITALFLIPGCGSGGGGAPTTPTPVTKTITVTLTDFFKKPVANVLVQLGKNGKTATTNASGMVTFTGASSSAHDIHMFPPPGLNLAWESIYQTTSSAVHWEMDTIKNSYVTFSGSVTNLVSGDTLQMLLENTSSGQGFSSLFNSSHSCAVTGTTYACSLPSNNFRGNFPIGKSGSFNLWALETKSPTAGGDVVNAVKLQTNYTVTATAQGGAAVPRNITFSATPPATSNLLIVNTVTPPPGVTVFNLAAWMPIPLGAVMGWSSGFGTPIVAYNPFSAGSSVWAYLDGSQGQNAPFLWMKFIKSTPGAAVPASTSNFSSLPVLNAQNAQGQSNFNIPFTPAKAVSGASSMQSLQIEDTTPNNNTLWNIALPPSATSVTLPTIPASVTPILVTGAAYKMQLMSETADSVTFEQAVRGSFDPTLMIYSDLEFVWSSTVNFTP